VNRWRAISRAAVCVGASTVLGLTLAAGGLAATSPVVPAGGKVAGHGYAYYLKRVWLMRFASPGPAPSCAAFSVGGEKVALLRPPPMSGATATCNEPAGRAMYVHQVTNECSTLKGDHKGFGTTNADLVKCAKSLFKKPGVSFSATLDGLPVNLHALVASTGEFFVPKVVGQSASTARSAAYGPSILLRALSKGTHTIEFKTNIPGVITVDSTLEVKVS
jgi:hypothetical protein